MKARRYLQKAPIPHRRWSMTFLLKINIPAGVKDRLATHNRQGACDYRDADSSLFFLVMSPSVPAGGLIGGRLFGAASTPRFGRRLRVCAALGLVRALFGELRHFDALTAISAMARQYESDSQQVPISGVELIGG